MCRKLARSVCVNGVRAGKDGRCQWPGFGENRRVLRWIIERCENRGAGVESPIGLLPDPKDIDVSGLDITEDTMQTLLSIDAGQWLDEMNSIGEYLEEFGDRLPEDLRQEHQRVLDAVKQANQS